MIKYEHPTHKGYFATEDGRIFKGNGLLLGTRSTSGYRQYELNRKTVLAHRIIYECFYNCTLKTEDVINHLDHDKQNNNISNLEKTTAKGNAHHYQDQIGRHLIKEVDLKSLGNDLISGENNYGSKLTKAQATKLIYLSLEGVENNVLGEMFGLHSRYVSLIRHKKRWKRLWVELGLESSETIPSGSRPASAVEAERTLLLS